MAITIDATVGGASANSFVTLTEFATFMEGRLNSSAFDDATTDVKNRALVEAARWLSTLSWQGWRVTTTQVLAWPRQWSPDVDSPNAEYYATTVIPDRVKRGQMQLAFEALKAGTTDVSALPANSQIQSETVDVISVTYFDSHARPQGLALYPSVMREIGPLLESSGSSARVVRG